MIKPIMTLKNEPAKDITTLNDCYTYAIKTIANTTNTRNIPRLNWECSEPFPNSKICFSSFYQWMN